MRELNHLIANNLAWAEKITSRQPDFFASLAKQQSPEYLWIGCSDSRVPANQIIGLLPGEVFVHRNLANVVVHSDLNCLSVMQFGVDVLKVKHILVVGHYGCAGVAAALVNHRIGLADNWLRHIQDIRLKYAVHLDALPDERRADRLVELNVIEQVSNVCQTTVVQEAWERGQELAVHGWTYSLVNGLVNDLGISTTGTAEANAVYLQALAKLD